MHINQTEPSNGFNLLYTSFLAFEDITISLLSEKVIKKRVVKSSSIFGHNEQKLNSYKFGHIPLKKDKKSVHRWHIAQKYYDKFRPFFFFLLDFQLTTVHILNQCPKKKKKEAAGSVT